MHQGLGTLLSSFVVGGADSFLEEGLELGGWGGSSGQPAKNAAGSGFFLSIQKVICLGTCWETVNRSLTPGNWSVGDRLCIKQVDR